MGSIKPLKRFGQNYLRDKNILTKIIGEIDPKSDDIIIEIGPGMGALTKGLLGKAKKVIGIEIDKRVIENLSAENPGLELINDDFLKLDFNMFCSDPLKKLRITGNIPYNITSPIIFKMIENHYSISDAVFMIQHEVAKRITSGKGTKDYGILSVIIKYFADVKYCFKVSPGAFYPKPKVDSAVIHIFFKEKSRNEAYEKLFIKVVKSAFGNRRKTLKNSLNNSIFGDFNFEGCNIDFSRRAEEFELNDFIRLTDFIYGETDGRRN
jgi:16S rRNA (adenine1518-N6/adenine1519-N6)-dimethyltransferase